MNREELREIQKSMIIDTIDYFMDKVLDEVFDYIDRCFDLIENEEEVDDSVDIE